MKRLQFALIGAAKSGTTTLFHYLSLQDPLCLFPLKDIHFFDQDDVFSRGKNWYWQQFGQQANKTIYGDISANYLYSETALKRIKAYGDKQIKILAILRDPTQRLLSEYSHHFRNGLLNQPLAYYLQNPDAGNEGTSYKPWHLLVERSLYQTHVERLYRHFNPDNIRIFPSEFLKNSPELCLNTICEFIGVDYEHQNVLNANQAFTPYSRQFMRLLTQPGLLSKIARKLVPSFAIRQKVRNQLIRLNTHKELKIPYTTEEELAARQLLTDLGAYQFDRFYHYQPDGSAQ